MAVRLYEMKKYSDTGKAVVCPSAVYDNTND